MILQGVTVPEVEIVCYIFGGVMFLFRQDGFPVPGYKSINVAFFQQVGQIL